MAAPCLGSLQPSGRRGRRRVVRGGDVGAEREAHGRGRGTARGAGGRYSRGIPVRRRHRAARRRSARSSCANPTPRRCPARTEPNLGRPSRSVRVPNPPGSATISFVTRWRRDGRGEQRMQPADRLHALDAVRAYALLLGVVLHSAAAFLEGFPDPDVAGRRRAPARPSSTTPSTCSGCRRSS